MRLEGVSFYPIIDLAGAELCAGSPRTSPGVTALFLGWKTISKWYCMSNDCTCNGKWVLASYEHDAKPLRPQEEVPVQDLPPM